MASTADLSALRPGADRANRGQPSSTSALHRSTAESPPMTPSSVGSGNPFSPPASIISFDAGTGPPPLVTIAHTRFSVPGTATTSRSSSASAIAIANNVNSTGHPSHLQHLQHRPTSSNTNATREPFACPPQRPLTTHSLSASSSFGGALPNTTNSNSINTKSPFPTATRREPPAGSGGRSSKSTMLPPGTSPLKPWLSQNPSSEKASPASAYPNLSLNLTTDTLARLLTYAVMFLGILAGAVRCFFGWRSVPLLPESSLCVVLDQNFDHGEQDVFGEHGTFVREVEMGGFGNGQFEMTTDSANNSFVHNGQLYILPTLTANTIGSAAIEDGHIFNITGCTFNATTALRGSLPMGSQQQQQQQQTDTTSTQEAYFRACSAVSNSTLGTVINPVQSARLTTRASASIRYGRVEVRAKIPTGDWLWPAIWMLPVENKYGPWPRSGEIDIMEARGNGPQYARQGTDWVRGSLNWGPAPWLNGMAKTFGAWHLRRGRFDESFHTYALEWTEQFIRIYVDSRLQFTMPVLSLTKQTFWDRGEFPPVVQNGSQAVVLEDPWVNGTRVAPFDQPFYLVLNVAVGGTSGWFPDGVGNKPWLDGSKRAMADFWKARNEWLPTWPEERERRAMVIDSVKMWQKCK